MEEELKVFYNKYKHIIKGESTLNDAKYILDKLNIAEDNVKYKLMMSLVNNNSYMMDYQTIFNSSQELNKLPYREDAYTYINKLLRNTNDLAQIKFLTKKANTKPLKPLAIKQEKNVTIGTSKTIFDGDINRTEKKCPHCKNKLLGCCNSNYIICGYSDVGYDLIGCGKDWCSKCEKMLCKSWNLDQLYSEENRTHNNTCCKEYAEKNKLNYSNFCQCKIASLVKI